MGGLRDELAIPFRGAGEVGRDLWEGSKVLADGGRRCACRLVLLARGVLWRGETFHDRLEALASGLLGAAAAVAVAGSAGAAVVYVAAPYAPWIAGGAVVGWVVAALMAAPPREHMDEDVTDGLAAPTRAFALWLLELIGDRPGIHLRELYPAMRQLPGQEDREDGHCRAALRGLGIPIHRSLRIGDVAGRSGVRRADVEVLLSPGGELPVDGYGDAGQSADSPLLYTVGEDLESA